MPTTMATQPLLVVHLLAHLAAQPHLLHSAQDFAALLLPLTLPLLPQAQKHSPQQALLPLTLPLLPQAQKHSPQQAAKKSTT